MILPFPWPYSWQSDTWTQLRKQQQSGVLPQALLVTGLEGVGKTQFCRALAATGLCLSAQDSHCRVCPSCQQLSAGSHPDYVEIGLLEGKREILIDQVREFCRALQLTASQSNGRYALIRDADRLNLAASNALLKTLEEPPRGLTILLTARQLSRIPATIRSRCFRAHLPMPDQQQSHEWLSVHAPETAAPVYSRRLGPCQAAQQEPGSAASRTALEPQWRALLEKMGVAQADVLKAAQQFDNEQCEDFLAWWQSDLLEGMKNQSLSMDFRRLWDALVSVRRQGQGSFNRLLTLEGLFILYTQIAARHRGSRQ